MNPQVELEKPVARVAVVRALNGIGDMLVTTPALRALRAAYPQAEIALIGRRRACELLRRLPGYVDEVALLPAFPGIEGETDDVLDVPAFFSRMHAHRFDLAIQMHGTGATSNILTALLGAGRTLAYYVPEHYRPDPRSSVPYRTDLPEPRLWLALLENFGIPSQGESLEFPLFPDDLEKATALLREAGVDDGESYVVIHAGAADAARRWGAERFAAVADRLATDGLHVVLTGSPAEREVAADVALAMRARSADLSGRTDLGTLGAIVDGARLVVCNDNGVSHVAAARGVASVVTCTPLFEYPRWAPLDERLHRIVMSPTVRTVVREARALLDAYVLPARPEEDLVYAE
jgi:ADP-heptose:LPS heptosyltransferase